MITEAAPAARETATGHRNIVVVVLGAGRSGTSAITRGVQALGVDLGDKLRPPGGKNPTGFFEDQDLLALNKRLKRALGIRGHSLRLLDDAVWEHAPVQALQREAQAIVTTRFGNSPLWGFKYGRTLRMLPFWQRVFDALNIDVRYVVALRNPLSVARSRTQLNPDRGRQAWNDLEWLVNVVPYFDRVQGHPSAVIDFDVLLEQPAEELRRAGAALQLPDIAQQEPAIETYAQGFLKPGMRHSQFQLVDLQQNQQVNPLVRDAYAWLHRLAHGQIAPDSPELWHDWARIQSELNALAPVLTEFDYLRLRLNRALWNPATPLLALRQLWRDWRSR